MLSLCRQFFISAFCTGFNTGSQVNLYISIRQNICSNVPAIHNYVFFSGKRTLEFKKLCTDFRDYRSFRGHISNLLSAKLFGDIFSVQVDLLYTIFVSNRNFSIITGINHSFFIIAGKSFFQKMYCKPAVHGTSININVSFFFCNQLCNGTFSCTGRSINRYIVSHSISILRFLIFIQIIYLVRH